MTIIVKNVATQPKSLFQRLKAKVSAIQTSLMNPTLQYLRMTARNTRRC